MTFPNPSSRSTPSLTSASTKLTPQVSLSRRLLFPNLSATTQLPNLLASPSASSQLNAELYDFIALALRAFVNPWWSKITRYDKDLVPEINHIIAIVIRALEDRILTADISLLLFRHIPILVTQHYRDYRNAASKLSTSYATGTAASLPQLFHQLQPHMAISADGRIDEEYFRQIVDHILKTCLPPEDYEPDAERFLVREIILKVLLQDVIPRITQPWFLQKLILDEIALSDPPLKPDSQLQNGPTPSSHRISSSHFSFHTLLVIFLSAVQSISGVCLTLVHAYKQLYSTIKLVNKSPNPARTNPVLVSPPTLPSPPPSPPLPSPTLSPPSTSTNSSASSLSLPPPPLSPHVRHGFVSFSQPDYVRPLLEVFAEIFTTRDRFASSALMCTLSMLSTSLMPFFDRLLPHLLTQTISPGLLTTIAQLSKRTLFPPPSGYPTPPSPEPSPSEKAFIRSSLLSALITHAHKGVFQQQLSSLVLGKEEGGEMRATLEGALDGLGDRVCNVHLVVFLLDRIVLGLWPELGVGSGSERTRRKENVKAPPVSVSVGP